MGEDFFKINMSEIYLQFDVDKKNIKQIINK